MRLRRHRRGASSGCEHHNRGLERFDAGLVSAAMPSISDRISQRLDRGEKVRLLEIGCGEGRLLLEVFGRFGGDVELDGINSTRWAVIADERDLLATNKRYDVVAPETLRRGPVPTIHLADAQDLSGLAVGGFDLIVSQLVLAHIIYKDRVLQESARLLGPGGEFVHELDHIDPHSPDSMSLDLPRFVIHDDGTSVSTRAHLERHGIEVRTTSGGEFHTVIATLRKGSEVLDLGLRLDERATTGLKTATNVEPRSRWGTRSVYRRET